MYISVSVEQQGHVADADILEATDLSHFATSNSSLGPVERIRTIALEVGESGRAYISISSNIDLRM